MRRTLPLFIALLLALPSFAATPTPDDVQTLKRRLYDSLLPQTNRRRASPANAQQFIAGLRPDGSWGDVDYADRSGAVWKPAAHTSRLVALARAFRAPSTPAAEKQALRSAILLAYDYWTRTDPQSSNWWYNQIGSPESIGGFLILMDGELSPAQVAAGVKILKRATWQKWTGQNLVWGTTIQIVRGCVENSPQVVAEAYDRTYQEIRIAGAGEEGIQSDFSFHQHGAVIYSGGYGAGFTADCARYLNLAAGTAFAPPPEKLTILQSYILDHQQWATYRDLFDYSVTGREICRINKSASGLLSAARIFAALPGARQAEFAAFAKRLSGDADAPPLLGNRHFWKSDYMVHRRPTYMATVHMHSTRMANTDGNHTEENKKSHHLGDGACLLYTSGDEYRNIFPVWDWLRIPGATIEQNTPLIPARVKRAGTRSFVGGVSDGTTGLCVMGLKYDQLTARKAWFFFDDLYVCLGSGIACPTDNPVLTSINQCFLRGPVIVSTQADALPTGSRDIQNCRYALHDSVGYLFPSPTTVHLANQAQTGAWSDIGNGSSARISKDVFSLYIHHGHRPENAGYQYIIIPKTDTKSLAALADAPLVETLSNTPDLQAVQRAQSKIVAAAFYRPGELKAAAGQTISVDQPCLLMLKQADKATDLTLSNPENKPLTVNVEINRAVQGEGVTHPVPGRSRITVELPGGLEAGRSTTRKLTD